MFDRVTGVPVVEGTAGTGSARLVSAEDGAEGTSFAAIGSFRAGIGQVDFVLVDLGNDRPGEAVDRRDIQYAAPLPNQVSEAWTPAAPLAPGGTYRVVFHVY